MNFEIIDTKDSKWNIYKQIMINSNLRNNQNLWMFDAKMKRNYILTCPECNENSTRINQQDVIEFDSNNSIIPIDDLKENGGGGMSFKVLKCKTCNSHFYLGFGYIEPSMGRDICVLHNILQIEPLKK